MTYEPDQTSLEPWAHGLSMRELNFVREFLVDLNSSRAAVDSDYYHGSKDPQACAHKNSWRILQRPAVLKAIAAAMEERALDLRITAKTVLAECWRCYLTCVGERNWKDARGFLEMAGKHVDVKAFRDRLPAGMRQEIEDADDVDAEGLANLSLEELETLARLSRKAAGMDDAEGSPSPLRH